MSIDVETRIRKLIKNFSKNVDLSNIGIEENIVEYGINSLIFIKFIVTVEEEFNVDFDDSILDFENFPNLKSLIIYVQEKLKYA